jgi:hypothetical protein
MQTLIWWHSMIVSYQTVTVELLRLCFHGRMRGV